jgi:hypothetical protein
VDVRKDDDVGAPSARVYKDSLHIAKALEDGADVGLEVRLANMVVVAKDCVFVVCPCEAQ